MCFLANHKAVYSNAIIVELSKIRCPSFIHFIVGGLGRIQILGLGKKSGTYHGLIICTINYKEESPVLGKGKLQFTWKYGVLLFKDLYL